MPLNIYLQPTGEQFTQPHRADVQFNDSQTALLGRLDPTLPSFFDDVDSIANDIMLPDQFDAQFSDVYKATQQSINEEIKELEAFKGEKLGIKSDWMVLFSAGLNYQRSLTHKAVDVMGTEMVPQSLVDAFNERISWMMALRFRDSLPSDLAHIQAHTHRMMKTQTGSGTQEQLLVDDIHRFGSNLLAAINLVDGINAMDETKTDAKLAPDLALANKGLIEATKTLSAYGLKPALVRAIAGGRINDWMVIDFSKDVEAANVALGLSIPERVNKKLRILALFMGATTQFSEVGQVYEVQEDGTIRGNFAGTMKGKMQQSYADMSIGLRSDGALVTENGTDIALLVEHMGKQVAIEVLRAELLTLYSDLVLPAYIIDREGNPRDPGNPAAALNSSKKLRAILNLALARTKLIGTEEVKAALIKESRRKPREHPVEEFVRDLPKGHRASPQSQERYRLFKESQGVYGAVLPPGKNFVGRHMRGTTPEGVQPIEGHRASRNIAGGAVVVLARSSGDSKPPEAFDASIFGK